MDDMGFTPPRKTITCSTSKSGHFKRKGSSSDRQIVRGLCRWFSDERTTARWVQKANHKWSYIYLSPIKWPSKWVSLGLFRPSKWSYPPCTGSLNHPGPRGRKWGPIPPTGQAKLGSPDHFWLLPARAVISKGNTNLWLVVGFNPFEKY